MDSRSFQNNFANLMNKRKEMPTSAASNLSNLFLGRFRASVLLGNVSRVSVGQEFKAIMEKKWNFISDCDMTSYMMSLGESQLDNFSIDIQQEMCAQSTNQDIVIAETTNSGERRFSLLRHCFSEIFRCPIAQGIIELRVTITNCESENYLFEHISESMMKAASTFARNDQFRQQPPTELVDTFSLNKFRAIMAEFDSNAITADCNVDVYLKPAFFKLTTSISKETIEAAVHSSQTTAISKQIQLLSKDSLYLIFDFMQLIRNRETANAAQMSVEKKIGELRKKIPIASRLYSLKVEKKVGEKRKKATVLIGQRQQQYRRVQDIDSFTDPAFERVAGAIITAMSKKDIIVPHENASDAFVGFKKVSSMQSAAAAATKMKSSGNAAMSDDDDGDDKVNDEEYDDRNEDEDLIMQQMQMNRDDGGDDDYESSDDENQQGENVLEGKFYRRTDSPLQMLPSHQLKDYQKQGLTWMLFREQRISRKALFDQGAESMQAAQGEGFDMYELPGGEEIFYNCVTGVAQSEFKVEEERLPVCGGILADQMGLGKTIMATSLILAGKYQDYKQGGSNKAGEVAEEPERKIYQYVPKAAKFLVTNATWSESQEKGLMKEQFMSEAAVDDNSQVQMTLIVVPKSLVRQWVNEIKGTIKQPNMLNVFTYEKSMVYDPAKNWFKGKDVVVTTYGVLTQEFRACCNLKVKFRWCLTGTPLQNKLDDLFSYFQFMNVPEVSDWKWWKKHISKKSTAAGKKNQANNNNNNDQQKNDEQSYAFVRAILNSVMLRRTKKTKNSNGKPILKLPKKEVIVEQIKFSPLEGQLYDAFFKQQQELFERLLADMQNGQMNIRIQSKVLVMINSLRMMCNSFQMVKIFSNRTQKQLETIVEEMGNLNNNNNNKMMMMAKDTDSLASLDSDGGTDDYDQETTMNESMNNTNSSSINNSSTFRLAKTERVLELIRQIRGRKEKVVLFTQWHDSIGRFQGLFKRYGIGYCLLHGKMSIKERAIQINEFSINDESTVMILSLMAGCVGLNLTCANNVIMMDPWWNGQIEQQAIDRIYRIGQMKDIKVYRCFIQHENSIDVRINELQEKKEQIITKVLNVKEDRGVSLQQNLSIEDFKFIFGITAKEKEEQRKKEAEKQKKEEEKQQKAVIQAEKSRRRKYDEAEEDDYDDDDEDGDDYDREDIDDDSFEGIYENSYKYNPIRKRFKQRL